MACSITLSGRGFPCKTGIAGIKRVWVKVFEEGDWGAPTAGAIAAPTGAVTYYGFEPSRNAASLVATPTVSVENGSVYYAQVVDALNFPVLTAADTAQFQDLVKSRLSVIVQDANDNYLLMGRTMGVEATGGAMQTGGAAGDLHGWTLQLTANDSEPPAFIDATATDLTLTQP